MPTRRLALPLALAFASTHAACVTYVRDEPPLGDAERQRQMFVEPDAQAHEPEAAPAPAPPPPVASLIEEARLVATIKSLPEGRAFRGSPEQIAGLDRARDILMQAAKDLGYHPSLFTVHWSKRGDQNPRDWHNVVFELKGEGPLAREVILIGAHYDAVPTTPGADDNASGVAALMEIARVLKDRPHQRTIRFIFFTLEEGPLAGSIQYAEHVSEEVKAGTIDLVAVLSFDMLGFYNTAPKSQRNPFKHIPGAPQRDVADFLALCAHSRDAAMVATLVKEMKAAEPALVAVEVTAFPNEQIPMMPPDLLRSDHAPFITAGFPAIMVTDTSEFRNANYHKPTDTLETLNMPYYVRTVRGLAGGIHAIAGTPGQPAPDLKRPAAPEAK